MIKITLYQYLTPKGTKDRTISGVELPWYPSVGDRVIYNGVVYTVYQISWVSGKSEPLVDVQ